MKEKIFKNFIYFAVAGVSTLTFCNFTLPYLTYTIKYNEEMFEPAKMPINGYSLMNLWNLGFCGVMTSIIQILILTLSLLLLILSVGGVLKIVGVLKDFPDKLGKYEIKRILYSGLILHFGLNCLLLIFLIVVAVTSSGNTMLYTYKYNLNIGIFMMLAWLIGSIIVYNILPEKILSESK